MNKQLGDRPVRKRESTGRLAFLVAAGILLSRLVGLVRLRVFSHYFGLRSDAADAFNAAFRIPNFLQNLFGEGVLSASFIPVYARLLAEGEEEEAGKVAGAVGATLALAVAVLCLAGVLATPWLIDLIAPGFSGSKRDLDHLPGADSFPGRRAAGVFGLVPGDTQQSSKTVSVLRRARDVERGHDRDAGNFWRARHAVAIGDDAGMGIGGGQRAPVRHPIAGGAAAGAAFALAAGLDSEHVRTVIRNFAPVFVSRGVVQISAYIDALLASLLPTGAVTGLINAQIIYVLPGEFVWHVGIGGRTASDVERDREQRGNSGSAARAHRFRIAAHCVLYCSIGRGISRVWRPDRRRAIADRPLYAYRRAIRLGHSRGVFGWIARVHHGALVFVGLLRFARHAHAVEVRRFARRTDHCSGLHLRQAAARVDRDRSALGRGGIDGIGGNRRMGGVCFVAARAASQIRRWGFDFRIRCQALAGGGGGSDSWQRRAIAAVCIASHLRRDRDTGSFRCGLSC